MKDRCLVWISETFESRRDATGCFSRPAPSGLGPPLPQPRARPALSAGRLGGAQLAPPPPSARAGGVAGEGRDVWGAGVPMTASERAAPGRRARSEVPGLSSHPGRWVWVRRGWRARRDAPGRRLNRTPSVFFSLPGAPHWAGLARSSSLRGSAFVIVFANFPGGPVPSGRSRGWSCQDSFEAPGVDCWDGEAKSKLQSLTWSVTTTRRSVITPPDGVTSVYPGPGT